MSDADALTNGWLTASRTRNAIMLVRGKPEDQIPRQGRELAAVARAWGIRPAATRASSSTTTGGRPGGPARWWTGSSTAAGLSGLARCQPGSGSSSLLSSCWPSRWAPGPCSPAAPHLAEGCRRRRRNRSTDGPPPKGGYKAGGSISFSARRRAPRPPRRHRSPSHPRRPDRDPAPTAPPVQPLPERTEVDGQPAVGDDAAIPRDSPCRSIVDVALPEAPAPEAPEAPEAPSRT